MKKAIVRFLLILAPIILAYSLYQAYVQLTVCAPIYRKLDAMSVEPTPERNALEHFYFSNNCR